MLAGARMNDEPEIEALPLEEADFQKDPCKYECEYTGPGRSERASRDAPLTVFFCLQTWTTPRMCSKCAAGCPACPQLPGTGLRARGGLPGRARAAPALRLWRGLNLEGARGRARARCAISERG